MTSDALMMQLEVRDFVNRGCATNADLYKFQRPAAAAPAGAIVNASQVPDMDDKENTERTQIVENRLTTDTSFIFLRISFVFSNHQFSNGNDLNVSKSE